MREPLPTPEYLARSIDELRRTVTAPHPDGPAPYRLTVNANMLRALLAAVDAYPRLERMNDGPHTEWDDQRLTATMHMLAGEPIVSSYTIAHRLHVPEHVVAGCWRRVRRDLGEQLLERIGWPAP